MHRKFATLIAPRLAPYPKKILAMGHNSKDRRRGLKAIRDPFGYFNGFNYGTVVKSRHSRTKIGLGISSLTRYWDKSTTQFTWRDQTGQTSHLLPERKQRTFGSFPEQILSVNRCRLWWGSSAHASFQCWSHTSYSPLVHIVLSMLGRETDVIGECEAMSVTDLVVADENGLFSYEWLTNTTKMPVCDTASPTMRLMALRSRSVIGSIVDGRWSSLDLQLQPWKASSPSQSLSRLRGTQSLLVVRLIWSVRVCWKELNQALIVESIFFLSLCLTTHHAVYCENGASEHRFQLPHCYLSVVETCQHPVPDSSFSVVFSDSIKIDVSQIMSTVMHRRKGFQFRDRREIIK